MREGKGERDGETKNNVLGAELDSVDARLEY
jgi:hypothetical protein